MAKVQPFKAIRPSKGLEERIAALPYDVYNRSEAKTEVLREPMSFLRIDRAETMLDDSVDTYDEIVYQKAHDELWNAIDRGDFVKEDTECYYIYRQIMNGRKQTGIVACASIDDYCNEVIKKHENTREDKELDRIHHVDTCNAQTGPIFLAYRADETLREILMRYTKDKALYDFTSTDGIVHQVWIIKETEDIRTIQKAFDKMQQIYIADGHHRCASAVKVGLKRRSENPTHTGEEAYNYFLSVLFADEELMIMDYNRIVRDLNGNDKKTFLQKIEENFKIKEIGNTPYSPRKKGEFGMFLGDSWFQLIAKQHVFFDDPVAGLDVSVLQNYLLEPILGIADPKTDKRIDFVGGIRGLKELEKRVHEDMKVAFSMYPTSIGELFAVADAGELMPPKSTWFEPKLRSGLFIHSLQEKG